MSINLDEIKKNKKEIDPQEARYRRRKDAIKNFAIIFLAIMLVLTFFSNTIMNYSLPQVAVQNVEAGSITSTIRGTGTVESGDPYNVMVKETRTVNSIACRVGQSVQKGDLLFTLESGDSTELEAAKAELEAAQDAYDDLLLKMDITASIISSSQGTINITEYRAKITALQNEIEKAQKECDELTAEIDKIQNQISIAEASYISEADKQKLADAAAKAEAAKDKYDACGYIGNIDEDLKNLEKVENDAKAAEADAKTALDNAEADLTAKETALTSAQQVVDDLVNAGVDAADQQMIDAITARDEAETNKNNAVTARDNAAATYTGAQAITSAATANVNGLKTSEAYSLYTAYVNANKEYNDLNNSINNRQNSNSDTISSLRAQKVALEIKLAEAQKKLNDKSDELGDLIGDIGLIRELNRSHEAIVDAQKKVDKIAGETAALEIMAPISGTIISINIVSGKKTDPSYEAVVIQPEGQEFTMSFSVTNEEAKSISVGDVASVTNSWWYNDVTGYVASIRPDTSAPNTNKKVTLNLNGSLTNGQTLTMTIDTRTANYDCIVPNNAIHEDNNGKFILVVESKSSPLGNRYFATRYDIQVLAHDDNKSAVKAGLAGYEYVITTASKPISAGDQVRLTEK